MSTNIATPSFDSVFESAQRAHAVISLLIGACSTPVYGDDITYSLWAVEREIREIKGSLDAILWDKSKDSPAKEENRSEGG